MSYSRKWFAGRKSAIALLAGAVLLTTVVYAATESGSLAFLGVGAGASNTSGTNNTFLGSNAGNANTEGFSNTFVGTSAGAQNLDGDENTFVGVGAGLKNTASDNSFFGRGAGTDNTTGLHNSFFGHSAGRQNTTASGNSFFGYIAGENNTTGANNAFFGRSAGATNTIGSSNAFFGRSSGVFNTEGFGNAFFGYGSGQENITGTVNTFIGMKAGEQNTLGWLNAFFGQAAGISNTTGSNNSILGTRADLMDGLDNAAAVGYRAYVAQDNSLVLGSIPGVNEGIDPNPYVNVGIGTTAPMAPLHIRREDGTLEFLRLESDDSSGAQDRAMMDLTNNGGIRFQFTNALTADAWRFQAGTGGNDNFEITKVGSGVLEMVLQNDGDLIIAGALTQNSDVNSKQDIEAIDGQIVLAKLDALPISEWTYKSDTSKSRHLGPMAQDFHKAFGLGEDETRIAPADMAGISLAAVKALKEQHEQAMAENEAIKASHAQAMVEKDAKIASLEKRLEKLEALMQVPR